MFDWFKAVVGNIYVADEEPGTFTGKERKSPKHHNTLYDKHIIDVEIYCTLHIGKAIHYF